MRLAAGLALEAVSYSGLPPAGRAAIRHLMSAVEAGVMAYWIGREKLFVVPRPLLRVESGELHCWDGRPAVEWEDGERFWFWRGVPVPEHVGSNPEAMRARDIVRTSSLEVRRVLIERFGGHERFLAAAGAVRVWEDSLGTLWRYRARGAGGRLEDVALVEVVNSTSEPDGSRRRYFLHVPPHLRTPWEAVAWTFGFDDSADYVVAAES